MPNNEKKGSGERKKKKKWCENKWKDGRNAKGKKRGDKVDRKSRQIDGLLRCIDKKKNNNQDREMQKHLSVHICADTHQRINANNSVIKRLRWCLYIKSS